jgi:hypothetical protein
MISAHQNGRPSDRIIFFLFVASSGFYITKITISPIYAFFGIAFILEVFTYLNDFKINYSSKLLYMFFAVIMIPLLLVELSNFENLNVTIGFVMSLLVLPILVNRGEKCKDIWILTSSKFLIWISIILFLFDTYSRISHPDFSQIVMASGEQNPIFYAFKYNGIMYLDSNFVGLQAVIMFGLTCYLTVYFKKSFVLEKSLLTLLIFLSFSRASVIALLAVYIFSKRQSRTFLLVVFVSSIVLLSLWGYHFLSNDDSFLTKGDILTDTFYYFTTKATLWDACLGIGFNHSVDAINVGAHTLIVMLLIERGLLGLILMLLLWALIVFRFKTPILYVLIPYWVNGFSLTSHSVPYLYVSIAVIIVLSKRMNSIPNIEQHAGETCP